MVRLTDFTRASVFVSFDYKRITLNTEKTHDNGNDNEEQHILTSL